MKKINRRSFLAVCGATAAAAALAACGGSSSSSTAASTAASTAGSTAAAFEQVLKTELPTNAIALVENRASILELCINHKVRAIVLTSGLPLSKEFFGRAREAGISVLISPYDIASTVFLTLYSMPVGTLTAADVKPVRPDDPVRDVLPAVQASQARSLPVVNDAGHVVGVINERDLYRQPNVDVIMVDHNELSLAVEGLDQFPIIEIIDHHKLGNFPTHDPIDFINRTVGSTATVVACLYQERKATLTPAIAGLLLSAIITDTLGLRSPTTTAVDRDMAEYLAGLLNLEVDDLAHDIFSHASRLTDLDTDRILGMDSKEYNECGVTFTVAQIETGTTDELKPRLHGLLGALDAKCHARGHFFAALMVTDLTALNSTLLVAGDPRFIAKIPFPRADGDANVFLCKGIMSRKKQLLPLLLEQLSALLGHQ